MATITVSTSVDFSTADHEKDVIIIAQTKDAFDEILIASDVCRVANIADESQLSLIKLLASSRLNPTADVGASAELPVLKSDGTLRRINIAALPLGSSRHNTPSRSHAVTNLIKSFYSSNDVIIILIPSVPEHAFAQTIAAARPLSAYSLKSKKSAMIPNVAIVVHFAKGAAPPENFVRDATNVIEGIHLAQRLIDTPPNILHTDAYVTEALTVASSLPGCTVNVIQGTRLEEEGFGGLWGVGKASEHLPALVVLSYVPSGTEDVESICLVGKGIVYDTGGLSIKTPTTVMAGMKIDMGGSAAVLGSFLALVKSDVKSPVHGLLCISENSVGPLATRPDDVHTMLSGKTVEVNNTDAEGRLVLSDGCFYAARGLKARIIVDIATLTGAQLIATGRNHAAIYCSDDGLEEIAVRAGKATGDLTHPIPYCPEFYRNEFRSQVADMKNSVADRSNAQASCAAQFIGNHLETFLSNGGKWLHVDMAGPVEVGERATGYGVALLFAIVKSL